MKKRIVSASREDYLEAILVSINKSGACRVTDVAQEIGYSKASTSVALKKLEEEELIIRDDWRILLTQKGRDVAENVYERHRFFLQWFMELGIDQNTAEQDACLIEHVLSEETYLKIRDFIHYHG